MGFIDQVRGQTSKSPLSPIAVLHTNETNHNSLPQHWHRCLMPFLGLAAIDRQVDLTFDSGATYTQGSREPERNRDPRMMHLGKIKDVCWDNRRYKRSRRGSADSEELV